MDPLEIDIALARRSFHLRIQLTVGPETVAVVGPSGAGKTSLLRAVAGLERPQHGRIAQGGETWLDTDRGIVVSPERRRVGYQPQEYGLFPHMTVAANVAFGARRDRPDLLQRFGIEHLSSARPGQLSGGERQRVALARALAHDPAVLLLDEPLSALDETTRHRVRGQLGEILAQVRLPTLLVTHAFDDATALADRIAVIDHGRLRQAATPAELIDAPADAVVAVLTGANVLDGVATATPDGCVVRLVGGGELRSTTTARGPVQVAVQPWELVLSDPLTSEVVDTVLDVRRDRERFAVRLQRFTVHVGLADGRRHGATRGATVGLSADPRHVRVLATEPLDGFVMLGP